MAANTNNGCSTFRVFSAANTDGILVKSTGGRLFGFIISNSNAADRFIKLYDKATAPTVGTDTPKITFTISGDASESGVRDFHFPEGIEFENGIGLGITTAVADNSTAAPGANEVVLNLFYK